MMPSVPLFIGVIVCFAAYVAGRALARRLLGIPGVQVLSRQTEAAYFEAPRSARVAWRAAGPVTAYAVCVALAFLSARASGDTMQTTEVDVLPGSRADQAGVQPGDRVVAVGGVAARSFDDVKAALAAAGPEHTVRLTVRRGGAELPIDVTTNAQGKLGIIAQTETVPVPFGRALARAVSLPFTAGVRALPAAREWLTGKEEVELVGPIGIRREVVRSGDRPGRHLAFLLMLLALPAASVWPLTWFLELALRPRGRRRAN